MGLHEIEPVAEQPSHAGTLGWVALGLGVLTFDLLAPETLSSAVDRALEHPTGRYAAIGGVAVTAAHLLNVFERLGVEQLDPFVQTFNVLERVREHVGQLPSLRHRKHGG